MPRLLKFEMRNASGILGAAAVRGEALEIAPGSDVDACVVRTPHGEFSLAVGAGLIAPLAGTVEILSAYQVPDPEIVVGRLPVLSVVVHDRPPTTWGQRRSPVLRARRGVTTSAVYTPILEVPWFGRRRGYLALRESGLSHSFKVKVVPRIYRPKTDVAVNMGAVGEEVLREMTVAAGGTVIRRISGEEAHTLVVYVSDGSGAAVANVDEFSGYD